MANGLGGFLSSIGERLGAAGAAGQDPAGFFKRKQEQKRLDEQQLLQQQQQQRRQTALEQLPGILGGTNIPQFRIDELLEQGGQPAIQAERRQDLLGALGRISPELLAKQGFQQAFPTRQKPVTLSPEQVLVDPRTGQQITQAPISQLGQQKVDIQRQQAELKQRRAEEKRLGILTPGDRKRFGAKGFELTGDIIPNITEVKTFRKLTASLDVFEKSFEKIDKIIDATGPELTPDRLTAKGRRIAKILQLEAKGPELFNLGVLTGNDEEILSTIIPSDPTAFVGFFNTGIADKAALKARFTEFRDFINNRITSRASSLGFRRKQTAGAPPATPTANIDALTAELQRRGVQ